MQIPKISAIAFASIGLLWPSVMSAQTSPDVQQIADTMVRLCVGGGRTQAVTIEATGGVDLSLRSLDATGKLQGQFNISRSSAEGLVHGLDNALSEVAEKDAHEVRTCLQPVRERLLDVMLPPRSQGTIGPRTVIAPGGVGVGGDVIGAPITISPGAGIKP